MFKIFLSLLKALAGSNVVMGPDFPRGVGVRTDSGIRCGTYTTC